MEPLEWTAIVERHMADQPGPQPPGPSAPQPSGGPTGNGGPSPLVLLVVAAGLVAGGYYLSVKLRDMARLQDCVMSGRTNCAPVDVSRLH